MATFRVSHPSLRPRVLSGSGQVTFPAHLDIEAGSEEEAARQFKEFCGLHHSAITLSVEQIEAPDVASELAASAGEH